MQTRRKVFPYAFGDNGVNAHTQKNAYKCEGSESLFEREHYESSISYKI
jgi:hypothetical protein